jgi:hypothetical protein
MHVLYTGITYFIHRSYISDATKLYNLYTVFGYLYAINMYNLYNFFEYFIHFACLSLRCRVASKFYTSLFVTTFTFINIYTPGCIYLFTLLVPLGCRLCTIDVIGSCWEAHWISLGHDSITRIMYPSLGSPPASTIACIPALRVSGPFSGS